MTAADRNEIYFAERDEARWSQWGPDRILWPIVPKATDEERHDAR